MRRTANLVLVAVSLAGAFKPGEGQLPRGRAPARGPALLRVVRPVPTLAARREARPPLPLDSVRLMVRSVARVRLFAPQGTPVVGVRCAVRTRTAADSAEVEPSGRLALIASWIVPDSVDLLCDAAHLSERRYRPSLLRLPAFALRNEIRIVLIPSSWTIEGGRFAGTLVNVSMRAALRRASDGGAFYKLSGARSTRLRRGIGWAGRAFPIAVALAPTRAGASVSANDSGAYWSVLRRMEEDFGEPLFRPAGPEEIRTYQPSIIVGIKPGMASEGATFVTWDSAGNIFDGSVAFRSAAFLRDEYLVMHEMMHALGFGHTDAWRSVVTRWSRPAARVTPEDVAYAQLMRRVREIQGTLGAPYGILEALAGEEVVAERRTAGAFE